MGVRRFLAVLIAFWLVVGPGGMALATSAASPCEAAAGMPSDDCCGDEMNAVACLSACSSALHAVAVPAMQTPSAHAPASKIPALPIRYATNLSPPDVAPPKPSVS